MTKIEQAYKAKGFDLEDTGGGVTVFIRRDASVGEVLVYTEDGGGVPERMNEPILVGFFGFKHDDSMLAIRFPSSTAFLASIQE